MTWAARSVWKLLQNEHLGGALGFRCSHGHNSIGTLLLSANCSVLTVTMVMHASMKSANINISPECSLADTCRMVSQATMKRAIITKSFYCTHDFHCTHECMRHGSACLWLQTSTKMNLNGIEHSCVLHESERSIPQPGAGVEQFFLR